MTSCGERKICCGMSCRMAISRLFWNGRSICWWPISAHQAVSDRLDHGPRANHSAQRGIFRLQSSVKYGIATAGSVRSREYKGSVPKRASWNSITSCRMQRVAQRPRAILNCGVEVTTSTRRSSGLALAGRPRCVKEAHIFGPYQRLVRERVNASATLWLAVAVLSCNGQHRNCHWSP